MDFSNLKMQLRAYQKVSPQVSSDYVTEEELNIKLANYVTEAPIDNKAYVRKDKDWEELSQTYNKPQIEEFVIVGLLPDYNEGDSISIEGFLHRESNIEHITSVRFYRDSLLLSSTSPSDSSIYISVADSFVLQDIASYKLEIETDIGDIYSEVVTITPSDNAGV